MPESSKEKKHPEKKITIKQTILGVFNRIRKI
jgi:hypothetical protein